MSLGLGLGLGVCDGATGPFSPAAQSGLISWGKLSDPGVVLNTVNVASVPDKANAGNTMVQATALNQPLFVASGINGKPYAKQLAGTTFLIGTLATQYTANVITIIVVAKATFTAGGRVMSAWTTAGNDAQVTGFTEFLNPATTFTLYRNGIFTNQTIADTTGGLAGVYSARFSTSASSGISRLSGVDGPAGISPNNFAINNFAFGCTAAGASPLAEFDLYEWAIISHALTAAELASWSAYTTTQYGLAT